MESLQDSGLLKNKCYINGQWVEGERSTSVLNPFDQSVVASVPELNAQQVEDAIAGAEQAFHLWKKVPAPQRGDILQKWHQLILEHGNDLATLITLEQGKPYSEALGEVQYAASFVQWYAQEAVRLNGESIPSNGSDTRIHVYRQAVGVVAAITPWNFPAAMVTRKLAPAIAAGCSIVLKPAPDTPLTAFALAELAERAGLPSGVMQVVTGEAKTIGAMLTSDKRIRKLSFTGSTAVGKYLMQQCAHSVKKLSLELGGNAPFIVFEDADLNSAIDGLMIAKFRNAGQTCVAANRIFIHEQVYDKFVNLLVDRVAKLKVGSGMQGNDIGPLIRSDAVTKVLQHFDDAVSKGAHVRFGDRPDPKSPLVAPIILTDVHDDMLCSQEETFGPLAALSVFSSEQEVITRANGTEAGLISYVYTRNLSRTLSINHELESGMVGINQGLVSNASAPFGGVKQSGLGREGGRQGIEEYLEDQYVLIGGL